MNGNPVELPCSLDALELLGKFVRDLGKEHSLPPKTVFRLLLAADELLTNTIIHGYGKSGRSAPVFASALVEPGKFTLVLSDTAAPFNPKNQPPPKDLDAPLEERDIGGLGIYLALKQLDQFEYEFKDGKNIHYLSVLSTSPQDSAS